MDEKTAFNNIRSIGESRGKQVAATYVMGMILSAISSQPSPDQGLQSVRSILNAWDKYDQPQRRRSDGCQMVLIKRKASAVGTD
ncbi:hypothetical protein [Paenibacillus dendritiformis]|uniref:hypothetical protein n=1 Tax=Paenibacillus dendritiformis TaxID=130049 RepID=UPI0011B5E40B|nr:hypothetical protein [Paenibacillus dendritiformis]